MKIRNLFLTLSSLVFLFGVLTACHTVAGAGQDVADTGHTITHAANATASNM